MEEAFEKSPTLKMYSRIGKATLHQYSGLFNKKFAKRGPDIIVDSPNLDDVLKKIVDKEDLEDRRKSILKLKPSSAFTSISRESISALGSRHKITPDPGWYNPSYELITKHTQSVPKFKHKKTESRARENSLRASLIGFGSEIMTERNNDISDGLTDGPRKRIKSGVRFDLQTNRPPFANDQGPPHPKRFSYNPRSTFSHSSVDFGKMLERTQVCLSMKTNLFDPNYEKLNSRLTRKIELFSPSLEISSEKPIRPTKSKFKKLKVWENKRLNRRIFSVPTIEKFDPCGKIKNIKFDEEQRMVCFKNFESAIIKLTKII